MFTWRYVAGNNWGICENGTGMVGCGPQEEFRACADVAISSQLTGSSQTTRPPSSVLTPHPTTASPVSSTAPPTTASPCPPLPPQRQPPPCPPLPPQRLATAGRWVYGRVSPAWMYGVWIAVTMFQVTALPVT
ncbi:hypothetical protein Hamer_G021769, partial [Homarus americanus]